jgi:hypothetical protein
MIICSRMYENFKFVNIIKHDLFFAQNVNDQINNK